MNMLISCQAAADNNCADLRICISKWDHAMPFCLYVDVIIALLPIKVLLKLYSRDKQDFVCFRLEWRFDVNIFNIPLVSLILVLQKFGV